MTNRIDRTRRDWANPWFAGSVAGALLLAAVGLALNDKLLLLPLLALPPLIASIGSGTQRTAIVGGLCVALAVALGGPSDMFASSAHVIDVITLVAIGLAAYWIARVRERLRHAERRSKLIADAGAALQHSLDPEAALSELANVAVPQVADWCVVHVKAGDGSLHQIAV